jgi:hypothetical protein
MDEGIRARLERSRQPKPGQERVFALIWAAIFGLMASKKDSWLCAVLAAAMLALGFLKPAALKPVLVQWMRLAGVLGAINTYVILTVIFYVVMTPYGFLQKLLSKDPLDEALRTGDSYWKKKEPAAGLDPYERQF